jgi:hypothetical protein
LRGDPGPVERAVRNRKRIVLVADNDIARMHDHATHRDRYVSKLDNNDDRAAFLGEAKG